jgi:hypothetical protein
MKQAWGAAFMAMSIASGTAAAEDFASRAQAMDYIVATLSKAIAANPKYLTTADGTLTQWVNDEVVFAMDGAGAAVVTLREHFVQTKAGKTVEARHEAHFALPDVKIGLYREPGDVTPSGEAAIGVSFNCKTPGCVAAIWGDAPSRADSTDFYVQDVATRDRLLAAFQRLQSP